HLADCVEKLHAHPELTWVYGAAQSVELATNRVLTDNCFYVAGQARPFLALQTRPLGTLKVIDDPGACRCAIKDGLYNGLQASVIRKKLFEAGLRLPDVRIGEDRCLSIQALSRGAILGYFNDVHVIVRIHPGNTSSASRSKPMEQRVQVAQDVIAAYEFLATH